MLRILGEGRGVIVFADGAQVEQWRFFELYGIQAVVCCVGHKTERFKYPAELREKGIVLPGPGRPRAGAWSLGPGPWAQGPWRGPGARGPNAGKAGIRVLDLSVNWKANGRTEQLNAAAGTVRQHLMDNQRICVHCNKSYHRAPIGAAAICKVREGPPPWPGGPPGERLRAPGGFAPQEEDGGRGGEGSGRGST